MIIIIIMTMMMIGIGWMAFFRFLMLCLFEGFDDMMGNKSKNRNRDKIPI